MRITEKEVLIGAGVITGVAVLAFVASKKSQKGNITKAIKNYSKGTVDAPVGTINLNEISQEIGLALGTAYPWYDPRHVTEDEDRAVIAVLRVPKPLIPELAKIYLNMYQRNLQYDLKEYLDDKWSKVENMFQ